LWKIKTFLFVTGLLVFWYVRRGERRREEGGRGEARGEEEGRRLPVRGRSRYFLL
jgi:hypothetical protein